MEKEKKKCPTVKNTVKCCFRILLHEKPNICLNFLLCNFHVTEEIKNNHIQQEKKGCSLIYAKYCDSRREKNTKDSKNSNRRLHETQPN